MVIDIDPWEQHYRNGAATWRGSPYSLPEFEGRAKVIDIGCGTGSTLIKAIEKGWEVTGLDASGSALDIAQKRLERRGLECHLELKDITDDGMNIGQYDIVLCHYILGALGKVARKHASANILTMMKTGSLLSFEDIAVGDVREGKGRQIEERTYIKGNGIVQHYFTLTEVADLFSSLDSTDLAVDQWKHGMMERKRIRGLMKLE